MARTHWHRRFGRDRRQEFPLRVRPTGRKEGLPGQRSGRSDFQPTTQQVAVHNELKEKAATDQQRLKLLLQNEVTAFNELLRQRNLPNVISGMQ